MVFAVEERSTDWAARAPLHVVSDIELQASPDAVFSVLSDDAAWPLWFTGMRRVRLNGGGEGIGVKRTVWIGAIRLDEHVVAFEEPCRIAYTVVSSNLPGLRALIAEWRLAPVGRDRTHLTMTVGMEASGVLGHLPRLARRPLEHWTKGAAGLAAIFS